jgi:hypothetical protein
VVDGVVDAEELDQGAFLFCRVANGAENAEKVKTRDGILVAQLLHCAGEDFGDGKGGGDGWRESHDFLQRLQHVLEGGLREFWGGVG